MKILNKIILLIHLVIFASACGSDEPNPDMVPDEGPDPDPPIAEVDSCAIINHSNDSDPDLVSSEELILLEAAYDDFERYVKEKDGTGLTDLLLHSSVSLFITGKEVSGIKKIRFNGTQFINNVLNNPPFELRIGDTSFERMKGAAISWANYVEVYGESDTTATGVDLFFYINTTDGWKLATTNNTYVLKDDQTDYETRNPMLTEPKATLDKLVSAFNAKNRSDLLTAFQSKSVFIVMSSVLSENFSSNTHTTTAFIDCIVEDERNYVLSVSNEDIEIKDQYLAKVTADYKITLDGQDLDVGKLVLTMIATPADGWRISAGALTY